MGGRTINLFCNTTVWDLLRCWWSEPHSAENCKCFSVCGIQWHPGKLLLKRNVPPHTFSHTHTSHHSLASYTKRLSFLHWHAGQIRLCWCKYQMVMVIFRNVFLWSYDWKSLIFFLTSDLFILHCHDNSDRSWRDPKQWCFCLKRLAL